MADVPVGVRVEQAVANALEREGIVSPLSAAGRPLQTCDLGNSRRLIVGESGAIVIDVAKAELTDALWGWNLRVSPSPERLVFTRFFPRSTPSVREQVLFYDLTQDAKANRSTAENNVNVAGKPLYPAYPGKIPGNTMVAHEEEFANRGGTWSTFGRLYATWISQSDQAVVVVADFRGASKVRVLEHTLTSAELCDGGTDEESRPVRMPPSDISVSEMASDAFEVFVSFPEDGCSGHAVKLRAEDFSNARTE